MRVQDLLEAKIKQPVSNGIYLRTGSLLRCKRICGANFIIPLDLREDKLSCVLKLLSHILKIIQCPTR